MSARTEVAQHLSARIAREGPLPVDVVMAAVTDAYYARGDVFGAAGDFTTAPEISQIFGELIGLWCATTWQRLGSPARFALVECGPGRGTLMADALRAAAKAPGFIDAAELHLVERSRALRARQAATLNDHQPTWHDDIANVPPGPTILVANEFLDALPIKQFVRIADGWAERHITEAGDRFMFEDVPTSTLHSDAPLNTIIERSPAVSVFAHDVAARIVRDGGAGLFIDYGYVGPAHGDTLQAVKAHKFHPVLEDLGAADLTAHVDFAAVRTAAESVGARALGPEPQGSWLASLGLRLRVEQLTRSQPAAHAAEIAAAANRLSAPDAMGSLFKVMAIAHPSLASLDGFPQDAAP